MTDDLRALLADLDTWPTYVTPDVHTDPGYIVTTVSKGQVAAAIRALIAKAEREPEQAIREAVTEAFGPELQPSVRDILVRSLIEKLAPRTAGGTETGCLHTDVVGGYCERCGKHFGMPNGPAPPAGSSERQE